MTNFFLVHVVADRFFLHFFQRKILRTFLFQSSVKCLKNVKIWKLEEQFHRGLFPSGDQTKFPESLLLDCNHNLSAKDPSSPTYEISPSFSNKKIPCSRFVNEFQSQPHREAIRSNYGWTLSTTSHTKGETYAQTISPTRLTLDIQCQ